MQPYIKNFLKLSMAGLVLAIVTACGHTPVSSLVKLRNFDPTTTDMEKFSIAVAIPNGFEVDEDGVTMVMGMRKKDGSEVKSEKFVLTTSLRRDDQIQAQRLKTSGRQILAYRVHPNDVERFNQIRRFALKKEKAKLWEGSFGIGTKICHIEEQLPKPVFVTTFIKSAETKDYVPFIVDLDLMKQAKHAEIKSWVPKCGSYSEQTLRIHKNGSGVAELGGRA